MGFGFSVYFGLDNTMEENIDLLQNAYRLGYSRIFTSLHIPEADYDVLKREVKEFFNLAKEYKMDIISDISPNTFKFLELENKDLIGLKNLGVKTIRIDFGYTVKEISEMSNNTLGIKIQFNASTITEDFFRELDNFNPNYDNIDALHNFYPRIGTGISEDCMIEKNEILHKRGIKTSAFIQINNRRRSPLKDGLPTLEDHRNGDVRKCSNHLLALGNTSVFIGDSLPSVKELEILSSLNCEAVELRINKYVNDKITDKLIGNVYSSRIDYSRDSIRAAESRLILDGNIIEPKNTIEKNYGNITIDNVNYGRYMGELQILTTNQNSDERTNVVGKIIEEDYYLLKYIKNGKKFYFKIIN